jgi:hypothetical protein
MQLDFSLSSDDGLLDAILDKLTINPRAGLSTALTEVDQMRAARTTGTRKEQHQTEQQQQRAADLQKKWTHVTNSAHLPVDGGASVDALTTETALFLGSVSGTTEKTAVYDGWRVLSPDPPLPSHSPGLVTTALLPLLSHLSPPTSESERGKASTESMHALRRAYLLLLPHALRAAATTTTAGGGEQRTLNLASPATGETDAAAWYCRCSDDPVVQELFAPYIAATVNPLERELRYHFSAGRDTAAIHEPQHFFSFLLDCVERQQDSHKNVWAAVLVEKMGLPPSSSAFLSPMAHSSSLLLLLSCVGQLALVATAVVVFQSSYGWHSRSPLWRCTDFVVVTVNAVLDFVARAEGRLCSAAIKLLLEHLLVEDVAVAYARAGVAMADAALQNGTARLWRRSFLTHNSPQPRFPLYTCSMHMVRALEAFLRRLMSTLVVVDASTYAALMWHTTVEPVLSHFLEVVETDAVEALDSAEGRGEHKESCPSAGVSSWDTVLTLQWCVASVQIVAAAAEDWLGMLRESASAAAGTAAVAPSAPSPEKTSFGDDSGNGKARCLGPTSEALDGLALFRDKLARRAAEQAKGLTRQLCVHKLSDSAQAAMLLRGLDVFLQQLATLPDESSRYVLQAVIQGVMLDSLPREQQAGLAAFAIRGGLPNVAHLLSSA